jgi:hypothetical protein
MPTSSTQSSVARLCPESRQGKRTSTEPIEVGATYVRHARFALRYALDLADSVTAGHISLDNAPRRHEMVGEAELVVDFDQQLWQFDP